MAITISNAFVEMFNDNVRHLSQQGDTRLRNWTYEKPNGGEKYNFERLGAAEAVQKSTDRKTTPFVDTPWTRRVASPQTWQWADTIEHADEVQMLVNPESAYSKAAGMAMKRRQDSIIIAAAEGNAVDGDGATVALPAGQKIAVGGTRLTLAKIIEANKIFQESDIDPDTRKVFVLGPEQVSDILNDSTLTSADYLSVKMLQANGMVSGFMGFDFVMSNRLTLSTNTRQCLAFTDTAIGLAVNQDIFTRIAERPDLSHAIQVYCEFTMGAVRIEDEHVVQIDCDET